MAKKVSSQGCYYCGRTPKGRPYGSKRVLHWCGGCDRDLVSPVSKGAARQAGKKEIREALKAKSKDSK